MINYFESIDENIAPKITSTANIVSIPLEVWNVIKNQSDTLQKQSDSLIIKDQQINKVINMLETQIEESKKTLTQVAEAVTYAVAR